MDFSKCLVDISKDEDQVMGAFASLHDDLKTFVLERDDGLDIPTPNIIKYIVACYDKESPVVDEYKKRWTMRKKRAASFAGFFDLDKLKEIDEILYSRNDQINKTIIRYLSLLYDRDFLMYAVYSELLINQSEQLMRFDFDKPADTARAKQNVDLLQNDLGLLEDKIFAGGDVRQLKNVLYSESHRFMVSELRPENIVGKLEKGEPIVDINPYGDKYFIDKMKFLGDN